MKQSSQTATLSRQQFTQQHIEAVNSALNHLFPSEAEVSQTAKARQLMGGAIDQLSDENLETHLTEFQHLLDGWFDEFERELFDGQTLKQVLGQG